MSYLKSVHQSCCRHGRTLQFWANTFHGDPEQLWNLPPGVIAMEYGHKVHLTLLSERVLFSPLPRAFRFQNTRSWGNHIRQILSFLNRNKTKQKSPKRMRLGFLFSSFRRLFNAVVLDFRWITIFSSSVNRWLTLGESHVTGSLITKNTLSIMCRNINSDQSQLTQKAH